MFNILITLIVLLNLFCVYKKSKIFLIKNIKKKVLPSQIKILNLVEKRHGLEDYKIVDFIGDVSTNRFVSWFFIYFCYKSTTTITLLIKK